MKLWSIQSKGEEWQSCTLAQLNKELDSLGVESADILNVIEPPLQRSDNGTVKTKSTLQSSLLDDWFPHGRASIVAPGRLVPARAGVDSQGWRQFQLHLLCSEKAHFLLFLLSVLSGLIFVVFLVADEGGGVSPIVSPIQASLFIISENSVHVGPNVVSNVKSARADSANSLWIILSLLSWVS